MCLYQALSNGPVQVRRPSTRLSAYGFTFLLSGPTACETAIVKTASQARIRCLSAFTVLTF
jgi:hypothetical protein